MNRLHAISVGMTPEDYLRPTAVGEPVVSHVLEDAKEPEPDFEAMRKLLSESPSAPKPPAASDDTK
jgi:hypothetical protein